VSGEFLQFTSVTKPRVFSQFLSSPRVHPGIHLLCIDRPSKRCECAATGV